MKKFINDVWTVQLPNKDIHISANVSESDIQEFVKGKGSWGQNALYINQKETLTVFDDTSEANNYINYVSENWERNFNDILEESSPQELNSIIHYVNLYKDGLISPEGLVCIPVNAEEVDPQTMLDITKELNPNYDTLSLSEQQALLENTKALYSTITGSFNSQ
jgi:hypothetical protein